MSRLEEKRVKAVRRSIKVRKTIRSNSNRPRLSVYVSNKNISAQIIDDATSKTVASASTLSKGIKAGTMTEKAAQVGKEIAKQAKTKKVSEVSFDRGNKLYHGRVKALADAAREEGLKF